MMRRIQALAMPRVFQSKRMGRAKRFLKTIRLRIVRRSPNRFRSRRVILKVGGGVGLRASAGVSERIDRSAVAAPRAAGKTEDPIPRATAFQPVVKETSGNLKKTR